MHPWETDPFWAKLRKRLKVVAGWKCRADSLDLWHDIDDFVQQALCAGMDFIDKQARIEPLTLERWEVLEDEVYRYAIGSLGNLFASHIRRVKVEQEKIRTNSDKIRARSGSPPQSLPDERLEFMERLNEVVGHGRSSKSPGYQSIAETLNDAHSPEHHFDNIDQNELADLSDVDANMRRDFARMVAKKDDGEAEL